MAHGRTVKVFGWYDNEWGYSCRLVDVVTKLRLAAVSLRLSVLRARAAGGGLCPPGGQASGDPCAAREEGSWGNHGFPTRMRLPRSVERADVHGSACWCVLT